MAVHQHQPQTIRTHVKRGMAYSGLWLVQLADFSTLDACSTMIMIMMMIPYRLFHLILPVLVELVEFVTGETFLHIHARTSSSPRDRYTGG